MRFSADQSLRLAPATMLDYRELARRRLPRQLFDYIDGGSYEEDTMRANQSDLAGVRLRQRVMRDVSVRDPQTTVLGQRLGLPVILGPVGFAGLFAPRAEVQAARAADAVGVPFVEATVAICGIEEVARATTAPPWFQLYVLRDRGYCEQLMARARAVGSPVLILTLDRPLAGARHRDTRNGLVGTPTPRARARVGLDFAAHPRWIRDVRIAGRPLTFGNVEAALPGIRSPAMFRAWIDRQFDPTVTWDDLDWVREHWDGRLVLKGILDLEDARRAAELGVDGVVVSNHGGRQLDSVPSSARALPAVVDAIGDQVEVLVDGGIRTGLDVVKMLALGARAVLIGRGWAWAVAARGERGVRHLLELIRADIEVALGLTGALSCAAIDRSVLYEATAADAARGLS